MQYARSAWLLVFMIVWLASVSLADAQKPDKPGKGGGGGGSGLSFSPVRLDVPNSVSATEGPIPRDISDRKHVVGHVQDDQGVSHALYWTIDENGVTSYDLGGDRLATGINEIDQIVGTQRNAETGDGSPVLWTSPSSNSIQLPLPTGYQRGGSLAVNDAGFIVGWAADQFTTTDENGDPVTYWISHAVAWRFLWNNGVLEVSRPTMLGGLEVNQSHWAEDVSAAEELVEGVYSVRAVGSAYNSIDEQAVTWEMISYVDDQGQIQLDLVAGPTELGTLPGDNGSSGDAINKHGDVVGSPGFRKLDGQPLEPLPPPSSVNDPSLSYVQDINDVTEVVGVHYHGFGEATPVLWLADKSALDLNKETARTEWASFHNPTAINNGLVIVGYGTRWTSKRKKSTEDAAFALLPN